MTVYNKVIRDQAVKGLNILNSDPSWQPYYYIPNFLLWQWLSNLFDRLQHSALAQASRHSFLLILRQQEDLIPLKHLITASDGLLGMLHFSISLLQFAYFLFCFYVSWCHGVLMSSIEVIHKQSVAEYTDPFKIWKTTGLCFVDIWKHAFQLMGLNSTLFKQGRVKCRDCFHRFRELEGLDGG